MYCSTWILVCFISLQCLPVFLFKEHILDIIFCHHCLVNTFFMVSIRWHVLYIYIYIYIYDKYMDMYMNIYMKFEEKLRNYH